LLNSKYLYVSTIELRLHIDRISTEKFIENVGPGPAVALDHDSLELKQVERMKRCAPSFLARFPVDQVDPT